MTPDPKDKILVVTSDDIDHEKILQSIGLGDKVVTIDGPVGLSPSKPLTLDRLQQTLRARQDATLDLVKAGLVAVKTPPITGGPRNGQRRNEPCHCGSGRKWKKCCGRGGAMDLSAKGGR